jgi:type I restriction enzyme, R subunit
VPEREKTERLGRVSPCGEPFHPPHKPPKATGKGYALSQTYFFRTLLEDKDRFRKEASRYVRQYSFVSQIMTFTDASLEKFYLFTKLLVRQLPYETQTLPLEVIEMIDMDKFRVQEEQNGRIILASEDAVLESGRDDGHREKREDEKEQIKLIVQTLNEEYGLEFDEADRVVNAIKEKLEADEGLKKAFKTDTVEILRRQKLQDSIRDAFLSNADEFLGFMSKTETDPAFGKFFFSEMFKWYSQTVSPGGGVAAQLS